MSSRANPNVVVLMGGLSFEREVSMSSGQACALALRDEGYIVEEVVAGADVSQRLINAAPDMVFNALHGRWGEDGCIQGLLEWLGLPYTHSGVLASALAMDKQKTKEIYARANLPIVESKVAHRSEIMARHILPPPYVVKPVNEGSSCGIYFVHESANGPPTLDDQAPEYMMVEAYVRGRELTTTVMGAEALAVTEIVTEGWYDYDAKYREGGSSHVIPAQVPGEITEACLDYAERAHRALGCRGVTRTDFRWDDRFGREGLVLLETNTQPGMTATSLSPEQAAYKGLSFGAFCRWMVEDASCLR
ncbi:MAG: D-alanine--D-alanine ligase [Paracoccaceae bacterium]